MRCVVIGQPLRSKLGMRVPRGISPTIRNNVVPAIPATYSFLFEMECNFNSCINDFTDEVCLMSMYDSANQDRIYIKTNASSQEFRLRLRLNTGAQEQVTRWRFPPYGTKNYSFAVLVDRDNTIKKVYEYGRLIANDAITVNPDFNTINNSISLQHPQFGAINNDVTIILSRFTTLTSVPVTIDTIMLEQWQNPMVLHTSLQGVSATLASQFDFEDQTVDDGTHSVRTINDNGTIGGYNMTSTVDLEDLIYIVEKP